MRFSVFSLDTREVHSQIISIFVEMRCMEKAEVLEYVIDAPSKYFHQKSPPYSLMSSFESTDTCMYDFMCFCHV